jgi:energy-coupling factor transport system permease protein
VLEDALERSLALAAGIDTRGYGRAGTATPAERRVTGALLLAALCGIGVGTYAVLDTTAPRWLAVPMLVAGVAVAVVGLAASGRRVQRSRYRPDTWQVAEVLVALSGVAVAVLVWWTGRSDLLVAHPGVEAVPAVSLTALVAVLLGLLPAAVAPPPRHAVAPALAVGA